MFYFYQTHRTQTPEIIPGSDGMVPSTADVRSERISFVGCWGKGVLNMLFVRCDLDL